MSALPQIFIRLIVGATQHVSTQTPVITVPVTRDLSAMVPDAYLVRDYLHGTV